MMKFGTLNQVVTVREIIVKNSFFIFKMADGSRIGKHRFGP